MPVGLALLFFVSYSVAVLGSTVLAIIGWALWVGFLRSLALCLKQPILAQESVAVTFSALKLGLTWMVAMGMLIGIIFLLTLRVRLGGCFAGFFVLTAVSGVTGLIRFLVLSDRVESITSLVLYPTGIPLIMRYMDLIGTLRMIILRRS